MRWPPSIPWKASEGESELPSQVTQLQEEGASAVPAGKSSHLSIGVSLPKCSFLQLFWFYCNQTTEATLLKQLLRHSIQQPGSHLPPAHPVFDNVLTSLSPPNSPLQLGKPPLSWPTFLALVPCLQFLFLPTKCGYSSEGPCK